MLTSRIIPCLDVKAGRVVKGVRFQNLRDAGCPVEAAAQYALAGADELVILDVSATREGRRTAIETVRRVREVLDIPLTVGGGVRSVEDARRLLAAGADKVAVNSAAVRQPTLLTELSVAFGRQCTVLSVDATRANDVNWRVVVEAGTRVLELDAVEWAERGARLGAGELLVTSFDRDGTRLGYDLELINAMSVASRIPVIASGGANQPEHLADAFRAGASAALAASIFHDGDYTIKTVKERLKELGVEVRI